MYFGSLRMREDMEKKWGTKSIRMTGVHNRIKVNTFVAIPTVLIMMCPFNPEGSLGIFVKCLASAVSFIYSRDFGDNLGRTQKGEQLMKG